MNKRQQAIELLELIPENKLDYIIAFLQGAAIPDRPMDEGIPESEESAEVPESVRGLEKSMQTLFSGDAMLEEQMMDFSEMDDVYSALEDRRGRKSICTRQKIKNNTHALQDSCPVRRF